MPVRRTSLVLVASAAILCSLLASPAGARTVVDDAGKAEPDSSSAAASAVLNDVRALFAGDLGGAVGGVLGAVKDLVPGLPTEATAYDLTLALRDLAVLKDELDGKDREEAEGYLARPTDDPGPNNPDISYEVEEEPPVCYGAICVHYVATTNDAPDDADGETVPKYVEDVLDAVVKTRNTYLAAGYRPPKSDGARGETPGSGRTGRTDFYIADIGDDGIYGYCPTEDNIPPRGPYNASGYCVLDDDYAEFKTNTPPENLQVTVAHEYFHVVQFAYDVLEDRWFLEATAAWAEDELYDDVDDNLQYLRESPMRLPRVPMDTFGGSFHYGTWIFFRYLSERYPAAQGGLPTVVRDMFRKADGARGAPDQHSIQAVKSVLRARGTDFPKVFAKFSAANRRPAATYSEGRANRYRPAPLVKTLRLGKGQSRGDTLSLDHLTSATVRFKPTAGVRGSNAKLRVTVRMARAKRGSAAVATVRTKSGVTRMIPLRLQASGAGFKQLPFSSREVRWVELTLANAGTSYDCFDQGPYSCQGTSKNENAKATYRARVVGG